MFGLESAWLEYTSGRRDDVIMKSLSLLSKHTVPATEQQ